jgi:hypothetical protein
MGIMKQSLLFSSRVRVQRLREDVLLMIKFSGMLRTVIGLAVSDVSKKPSGFIFRVKQSMSHPRKPEPSARLL